MEKLPKLGLGTYELKGDRCQRTIEIAYDIGYRHFDSADYYENHIEIGKALSGVTRNEYFITTKFSALDVTEGRVTSGVRDCLEKALEQLRTDFIDLYLIHWPQEHISMVELFGAMEALKNEGYIGACGVSNFSDSGIREIVDAGYQVSANQVEFHPQLFQKELLEACHAMDCQLISFRSFGKGELLNHPDAVKWARELDITPSQLLLSWSLKKGVPVIPKASGFAHLKENFDAQQVQLPDEVELALDEMHTGKRYCMPERFEA